VSDADPYPSNQDADHKLLTHDLSPRELSKPYAVVSREVGIALWCRSFSRLTEMSNRAAELDHHKLPLELKDSD
jgi:hypothetical protein